MSINDNVNHTFSVAELDRLIQLAAQTKTNHKSDTQLVKSFKQAVQALKDSSNAPAQAAWSISIDADEDFNVLNPVTQELSTFHDFKLIADSETEAWAQLEAWVNSEPCKPFEYESSRSKAEWMNLELKEKLAEMKELAKTFPSMSSGFTICGNWEVEVSFFPSSKTTRIIEIK